VDEHIRTAGVMQEYPHMEVLAQPLVSPVVQLVVRQLLVVVAVVAAAVVAASRERTNLFVCYSI